MFPVFPISRQVTDYESDDLSDILRLLQPKSSNKSRKPSKQSVNKKTVCITEDHVYDLLKAEAEQKAEQKVEAEKEIECKKVEAEKERERKKVEREQAKIERARNRTEKAEQRSKKKGQKKQQQLRMIVYPTRLYVLNADWYNIMKKLQICGYVVTNVTCGMT